MTTESTTGEDSEGEDIDNCAFAATLARRAGDAKPTRRRG
jgi:hypothetical protein